MTGKTNIALISEDICVQEPSRIQYSSRIHSANKHLEDNKFTKTLNTLALTNIKHPKINLGNTLLGIHNKNGEIRLSMVNHIVIPAFRKEAEVRPTRKS